MSFGKALNPGNINVRLGAMLSLEEQAIARGDLETAANCQGVSADYLSVFMTAKEWAIFEAMPGFDYDDARSIPQVNSDLSARRRYLLKIARDNNVFARGEVEVGDAQELDEEEVVSP